MRLAVIIPAYNEAKVIGEVLDRFLDTTKKLRRSGFQCELLVIDDGSSDKTAEIARSKGTRVVSHIVNLGLGGAISTGLLIARREGFDAAITIDSDGQHSPKDLEAMAKEVAKKKADFIVGSRWLKDDGDAPFLRRFGNKYVMNILTLVFTGVRTSDSQSGLRAFGPRAVEKLRLIPSRMEVSTEIFREVGRHSLKIREIPIEAIYTEYSLRKGQRVLNGLNITWRLMMRRLLS
ncbi:MAG: glycosyltransferase family 2 protein [Candidatus Berkelbacteria bacterium]|nr:MAG: glycosyltransferase family 2 protein [Candidatus Berkelbacteria bacterium]